MYNTILLKRSNKNGLKKSGRTAKLAMSGGIPVVPENCIRPWPVILEEDIQNITSALQSGKLWGRKTPHVTQLESELQEYFGTNYCILTQSGTSALHMAITALGIGPGDEVITTAYSFVATPLAVLHANAIPVFVDIEPETCNISVEEITKKISPATKAIIPVHMHGLPANMDEINALAKKHGLFVIEDACQAHGATYKGKKAGNLADVACFSLNGSKNLSAGGEGGFLLTNDKHLYEQALSVAMYGKNVSEVTYPSSYITRLGWMYRIQEIPAAFARSQLKRLDEYNHLRRKNAEYLSLGLSEINGIRTQIVPSDRTHVWFTYRFRVDPEGLFPDISRKFFREAIEKALFMEGIPIGQTDKIPLYKHPLFHLKNGYGKSCPWSCKSNQNDPQQFENADFPNVLRLFEDYTVIRGIHPPNDTGLMDLYLKAFHKVFHNLDEVLAKADLFEPPSNNCEMFGGYY